MNEFFKKLYSNPWGRLGRRFAIAGGSAVLSYFIATGKLVLSPEGLVDSVLALSGPDAVFGLKLFIGAGFLAAVDKMRREGTWKWLEKSVEKPVDKPVGEQ